MTESFIAFRDFMTTEVTMPLYCYFAMWISFCCAVDTIEFILNKLFPLIFKRKGHLLFHSNHTEVNDQGDSAAPSSGTNDEVDHE